MRDVICNLAEFTGLQAQDVGAWPSRGSLYSRQHRWEVAVEQQMIQELKAKYVGQWISVKDGELIETSERHEELYDTLKEKNISGAYVFYSPTESEKRYVGLYQST
jgi:hypothetical protein